MRLHVEEEERRSRIEDLKRKQQARAEVTVVLPLHRICMRALLRARALRLPVRCLSWCVACQFDERQQTKALDAADRIELLKFNIDADDIQPAHSGPEEYVVERSTIYPPVGIEAAPESFTGSAITLQNPSRPVRKQYLELVHGLPTDECEPIYAQMHPTVAVKARTRRQNVAQSQALAHVGQAMAEVTAAATSYCRLEHIVKAAEARAAAAEAFSQLLERDSSTTCDEDGPL